MKSLPEGDQAAGNSSSIKKFECASPLLCSLGQAIVASDRAGVKSISSPFVSGAERGPQVIEALFLMVDFLERDVNHLEGARVIVERILARPELDKLYDRPWAVRKNIYLGQEIARHWMSVNPSDSENMVPVVAATKENKIVAVLKEASKAVCGASLGRLFEKEAADIWARSFTDITELNPINAAYILFDTLSQTKCSNSFTGAVVESAISFAHAFACRDLLLTSKILDIAGRFTTDAAVIEKIFKAKTLLPKEMPVMPSRLDVSRFKGWYDLLTKTI